MSDQPEKINRDREFLINAQEKGAGATLFAFMRLSGPGWLQSAITLGGGSLAGSLYLGVLAGVSLLWLQPLFMVLGIIMLSAIGYVTLSTGERPFDAIRKHVNPVLAWAWAGASLMANIVWAMPQFALANSVMQQNLAPGLYGEDGLGDFGGKLLVAVVILIVTLLVTWCYGSGHWGIKVYEFLLKLMVAGIVISFFIVVYSLTKQGVLNWSEIAMGFIPDPRSILTPAPALRELIAQTPTGFQEFWTERVVADQRDRLVTAAATAVGINMTFLFPYSLLRKKWTKEFRGLQRFDLGTGMFIPFVLATSCVVLASFASFHGKPVPGLVKQYNPGANIEWEALESEDTSPPTQKEKDAFYSTLKARLVEEIGQPAVDEITSGNTQFEAMKEASPDEFKNLSEDRVSQIKAVLGQQALEERIHQLPNEDQVIAATLIDRDANRLAAALAPMSQGYSDWVFGLGVVGMTLSTITILMLISGFVFVEVFGVSTTGWPFRLSCSVAAVGVLGPFVWSKAGFALAVPTSVFGLMLLPIAYLSFFLLMNRPKLLKEEMPRGGARWTWNILMGISVLVTLFASGYMVWVKGGFWGVSAVAVLVVLALIAQVWKMMSGSSDSAEAA